MKIPISLALSLTLALCAKAAVRHFWRGTTMDLGQVERRFGKEPFDPARFRTASEANRSKMTSSMLKNKRVFIGRKASEIRSTLGDFDGFYFRDSYPTYIIHHASNGKEATWQIVFLLDQNFRVGDVIVHKNCCEDSQE